MDERRFGGLAKMIFIFLSACVTLAIAMPAYIAVPAEQIAFVDLSSLHLRREARQAPSPPPLLYQHPLRTFQHVPALVTQPIAVTSLDNSGSATQHQAPSRAPVRPPDFGEYVDFGAHTGNNGAFGWYADYPVNQNQNDDSYRK